MSDRSNIYDRAVEKATYLIEADMIDETRTAIASGALGSLTLTLYDVKTEQIINSVDHVSILNTGRGSVDSSGHLSITLTPSDNVLVGTASHELHVALIEWTYASGTKTGRHEITFAVDNFLKVT
jgi:hypothetical protein